MSKYVVVKGNQVIIAKHTGFVIFSGDLDFSSKLYEPCIFDSYFSAKWTAWLYGGQVKTLKNFQNKQG